MPFFICFLSKRSFHESLFSFRTSLTTEVDGESQEKWSPLPDSYTDRAPEIATGNYNEMVDVFGLGVSWQVVKLRRSEVEVCKKLSSSSTKKHLTSSYARTFQHFAGNWGICVFLKNKPSRWSCGRFDFVYHF